MPGQEAQFQRFFSRLEVMKGLAALPLAAGVAGCSSSGSSSIVTVTPTPTHTTPLRPGSVVYTYNSHVEQVLAVAWSPDGKRIASGSLDKSVQVWDALTGNLLYTYREHTAGVTALLWSPDGKRIASGSIDKSVQICDALTGNHLYTYRGHSDEITAVTWSPIASTLLQAQ